MNNYIFATQGELSWNNGKSDGQRSFEMKHNLLLFPGSN